jgi:hypothetical protein
MPRMLPSIGRRSRARGPREVLAALLFALGLLALLPIVAPLAGRFVDAGQQVVAEARKGERTRQAAAESSLPFADRSLRALCGDSYEGFRVDGVPMCTHGDDAPPEGYDRSIRVAPVQSLTRSAQTLPCIDDGRSGPRVQVLYVYSGTSRYDEYLTSMRGWVAEMNAMFDMSAAQTGGSRQLRIVTNQDCTADIIPLKISSTDIASFGGSINGVIDALDALPDPAQRYSSERNYLMFADTDIYCGIGTVRNDDRSTADNYNNFGGSFARADNGCWTGMVIAHEVMHNLGGVQLSAPNSSGGWHCVDERDIMCYSDTPYRPSMSNRCTTGIWATANLFDCNNDDYFSTAAPACSYLGSHWNASASSFLFDPTGAYQTTSIGPCLTLPVASGTVGSRLSLSARGFAPGETVTALVGGKTVGSGAASASGAITLNVVIPAIPGGAQAVVVSSASGSARSSVTVSSTLTARIGEFKAGKRGKAKVTGFGSRESITLKLGTRVVGRANADASGTATISFTIDEQQRSGRLTLTADGKRGSRATRQITVVAASRLHSNNSQ